MIELSRKYLVQIFVALRTQRPNINDYDWAFGDFEEG